MCVLHIHFITSDAEMIQSGDKLAVALCQQLHCGEEKL